MKRHDGLAYPYSRGTLIHGGLLVDLSEQAREQGISLPVAMGVSLARELEPNQFLSTFGITFEERIGNVLKVLKAHFVPEAGTGREGLPDSALVFPFIVLKGPLIKEELLSVMAVIHSGDDGESVVTLTVLQDEDKAA